ncbi:MAG: DegQ family serine endoprotease [Candidatus Binataceae bacterium]|jgi:serine protease Do
MFKKTVALVGGALVVALMAVLIARVNVAAFPLWGSGEGESGKPQAAQPDKGTQLSQAEPAAPAPAGQPEPNGHSVAIASFAPLVKHVMPTVVNVSVVQKVKGYGYEGSEEGPEAGPEQGPSPGPEGPGPGGGDPFEQFRRFFGEIPREFKQHGLGSGVIVSPDGYILTNNHVVGNADEIKVTLMDKREYTAKVVGKDAKTDVALIKINTTEKLPAATLGDSSQTQVGDWVVAIGNPFGFSLTVTAGIVSAKGRALGGNYDDFIQTDASINPGNSGGPLFDAQGNVVGINTAIYSRTGTSAGIGFAIPIDLAKSVMEQLKNKGHVVRGWLGVEIQEITPELAQSFGLAQVQGALVANVESGSPAGKAGIERGDVIVKFNGQVVADQHALPEMVAITGIGKTVPVELIRDGKQKTLEVTVGELKESVVASAHGEQPGADWGIQVGEITPELAHQFNLQTDKGVVIKGVRPDTPAADAGLEPGDVLLQLNREKISSIDDFLQKAKQAKKENKPALLLVQRGNVSMFTVVKPPA